MYDWEIIDWKSTFESVDIELVKMRAQSADKIISICIYAIWKIILY